MEKPLGSQIVIYNKLSDPQPAGLPNPINKADRMDNSSLRKTQSIIGKSKRFLLPVGVLIALIIVSAGGTYTWMRLYNPCEVDAVKEASAFLFSQQKTYDGQYQFTTTVSRTELAIPVSMLEQISIDTKAIPVPACMQAAKNELLNYMGSVNGAFRAYMAVETDPRIRDLLRQSDTHYDNFISELEAVNKCTPFCIP